MLTENDCRYVLYVEMLDKMKSEVLKRFGSLESALHALREFRHASEDLPVGWMFVVRKEADGVIMAAWKKTSEPSPEKPWEPIGDFVIAHEGLVTGTSELEIGGARLRHTDAWFRS